MEYLVVLFVFLLVALVVPPEGGKQTKYHTHAQIYIIMLRLRYRLLNVAAGDIEAKLRADLTLKPTVVTVKDISSGCGSFFHVDITSPSFQGKKLVDQHRMVNEAIKEEIRAIHGLTINTRTPK